MSLNKVSLIGNLGNDPDLKKTPNGVSVAQFSLATNERWTDKEGKKHEHVEWHRIVTWNKLAENVAQYCSKGKQVYVEGKLQTRSYDDKQGVKRYTTEIVANSVLFLGSAGNGGGGARPPHPAEQADAGQPGGGAVGVTPEPEFTEDSIPF